jgi:pilus assembly protein CpaC
MTGKPGFMTLPVIGALFRSRDFLKEETELMITMTPYIVTPTRPDKIARPDDGFVEASDAQGYFLGRVNRIYSTSSNPQLLQNMKGRVGFIAD